MNRKSGILMPMYSLPSPYGIGTMGKEAFEFVDFLVESKQTYWQLLPLCPIDAGDSPYSSPSTFAGNPFLIDLDYLIKDGYLTKKDVSRFKWGSDPSKVDYPALYKSRFDVLRIAHDKFVSSFNGAAEAFYYNNKSWLDNYALYMALKGKFEGKPWYEWPEDIKRRTEDSIRHYSEELRNEISFWKFTQFCFYKQWGDLKSYAMSKGISFIGDVPIYVAYDSVDVWSEPWYFQLDDNYKPVCVSGVPADDYNSDGQLWKNPLYRYDIMQSDGYGWWIRRIEGATRLYDIIRIDHFRGLESYWSVPANEETARNGRWIKGPGMSLVGVLTSWFHNTTFIAEDLGVLTPEVYNLLRDSGLPGMKVLEFAFDANGSSTYLPHRIDFNSCCYIGTHDNNTVLGWVETENKENVEYAREYMHITDDEGWCWGFIRTGMATTSNLFVAQMQDILELSGECRTNIPGVPTGNWRWRMLPGAISKQHIKKLSDMTHTYRRD